MLSSSSLAGCLCACFGPDNPAQGGTDFCLRPTGWPPLLIVSMVRSCLALSLALLYFISHLFSEA